MRWKIDSDLTIVVVGLGYVGLPTAVAFSKKYKTIGIDIDNELVENLVDGVDDKGQFDFETLTLNPNLHFSSTFQKLKERVAYIITVPTPVTENKEPDLSYLIEASQLVGEVLKVGDLVIYESTTFPGCTEEICVPELERTSGLSLNADFGVGYSPERLSPGNAIPLTDIVRVSSGSNKDVANMVDDLYSSILLAKTYRTPSIKVAEAAKLIENCQRDVNISFVNELALLFDKMGIDTQEVLKAAKTKWNFLDFRPGLVGGHCISVDPYYLIHKAKALGYAPEVIGAGRIVNENMGRFVAHKCMKLMTQKGISLRGAKALILGFAYKENCGDFRNTKVIDIHNELKDFGLEVSIFDPWVSSSKVLEVYGIDLLKDYSINQYDLIIHAVPHKTFEKAYLEIKRKRNPIIFDVQAVWPRDYVDGTL